MTTPPRPSIPTGSPLPPTQVRSTPPAPPPRSTRHGQAAEFRVDLALMSAGVVQPGDALVLVTSRGLSMAEAARLREDVALELPGVRLVIAEGFDQALVYRPGEVTHRCPPKGEGTTPCCGRTPFELPETDRLTVDDALVTCTRATDG